MLTRHCAGDAVDVRSAGSDPGAGVNPVVAGVLAERGLSVDDHVPTKLDSDLIEAADGVITMGCVETCPVFPGRRYEDWPVDDPAGQDVDTVRRIVDDVDARVRALPSELVAARGWPRRASGGPRMMPRPATGGGAGGISYGPTRTATPWVARPRIRVPVSPTWKTP